MIKKLLKGIVRARAHERREELIRSLIRREAKIGGSLFGPVPKGGRREFFCLDRHTWVWHEEWINQYGEHRVKTTRYDIRPSGILKAQEGQSYRPVSADEAGNLYQAAQAYVERVNSEVYSFAS